MKNPWTKKNPLLSMWLSGANAVAGSARGIATAAAKREAAAIRRRSARQITDFWTDAMTLQPTSKKKKRRR